MKITTERQSYLKDYYHRNRTTLLKKQRDRSKRNYQENKAKKLLKNKLWADQNKDRMRELQAKHRNTPKAKEYRRVYYQGNVSANRLQTRANKLKRVYRISIEDYDAMYNAQAGRCWICERKAREASPNRKGDLVVDHCHKTNRVRGLLCHHCNAALGQFQDSPALLKKAIAYLTGE